MAPGQLYYPVKLAVGANGNIYVTDSNNRVVVFSAQGEFLTQWGSLGSGPGQFNNPAGIAVTPSGDIYVLDSQNARIQKFGPVTATRSASWGQIKQKYR
jgi:DNA-binding beta-propeller fold protein YncE